MEQEKIYNNTNVNLKQTKLKLILFVILIAGIVLFSKGVLLISYSLIKLIENSD